MGLILCAALPISALAAFIAYDHYDKVVIFSNKGVLETARSVTANYGATVHDAQASATYLAGSLAPTVSTMLDPMACVRSLTQAIGLTGQAFHTLALVDQSGRTVCSAGAPPAHPVDARQIEAWLAAGAPFVSNLLGAPWEFSAGGDLQAAVPVVSNGHPVAVVLATLNTGPLGRLPQADDAATPFVWLVDQSNRTFALNGAPAGSSPAADELAAMRAAPGPHVTAALSGELFDYVRVPLGGSLDVVAGTPVREELAAAKQTFMRQVIEIGTLLFVGLALVAAGANHTVADPLNIMTRAVRRWRDGGAFSFGPAIKMPSELTELADTFGQAVTTLNEREKQLRDAKAQQELLMQEIHHRVKNNLQIIASPAQPTGQPDHGCRKPRPSSSRRATASGPWRPCTGISTRTASSTRSTCGASSPSCAGSCSRRSARARIDGARAASG